VSGRVGDLATGGGQNLYFTGGTDEKAAS